MANKQPQSFLALSILCLITLLTNMTYATPKNVIFMIGDGMGFEQVKAAGIYLNGQPGTLSFESFPYSGEVTTRSASYPTVTDSAAAGTALATGNKADNGVISMAIPGDGSELQTLLEYFRDSGKMTGLVTTSYMTDATPAAFGAHETSRTNYSEIAADYRNQTKVNVLLGGGGSENGMTTQDFQNANYAVVTDALSMLNVDTENTSWLCGQFGSGQMKYEADGIGDQPHLSEMALTALNILDGDPDGFFLMVEGGNIDHAGHLSDLEKNVFETVEFNNAVQLILDWTSQRDDTLVIVTADHETGGLQVVANNGAGVLPTVTWTGGGNHTGANVPVFAMGENAYLISGVMDNTDMFFVCTCTPGEGAWNPAPADGSVNNAILANLSWLGSEDAVSFDIYFGTNYDDVNDANGTFLLNQTGMSYVVGQIGSLYPDSLIPNTTYYWRVDEVNDIDPVHPCKGQVWSFFVPPEIAWNARPGNGEKFVDPNVTLSWSAALGISTYDPHKLYFGQSYNDVLDGSNDTYKGIINELKYAAGILEKDKNYYWRVDEAFGDGRGRHYNKGDVWTFAVNEYLVLDNFEDYNDSAPYRIIDTWAGGEGDPENGAFVGYTDPNLAAGQHYAETNIINGGKQSMPLFYDNNSMYSEASLILGSHRDWTEPNLPVLSIMFRGNKNNDSEPMYVAVSNNDLLTAMVYCSDPNAACIDKWTQWDIELSSFADMGINLSNVDKFFIGFGDPADIREDGGSGLVYFDNIRLYRPAKP